MNKEMLKVKLAQLRSRFNSLAPQEKKEFYNAYKEASEKLNDTTVSAQQRRTMANSVLGKYAKKITTLVASMLVVTSLLAGCDKEQASSVGSNPITINTSTIEQETDNNGNFVETRNEILARTLWAENEKIDLDAQERLDLRLEFDIDKVLNGTYVNNITSYMKATKEKFDNKDPLDRDYADLLDKRAYGLLDELLNEDASYAFDLYAYRNNSGNSYQILKQGKDTACVVITKRDGTKVVNGYLDGKAYYDGQDLVPNNIPLLTEEYANLILQTGTENPAVMWAQGVCGSVFGVDEESTIDKILNAGVRKEGDAICGSYYIKKNFGLHPNIMFSFVRNEEITHPNPEYDFLPNQMYYVDEAADFSLLGIGISINVFSSKTMKDKEVYLLGGYAIDPQQVREGLQTTSEAEK